MKKNQSTENLSIFSLFFLSTFLGVKWCIVHAIIHSLLFSQLFRSVGISRRFASFITNCLLFLLSVFLLGSQHMALASPYLAMISTISMVLILCSFCYIYSLNGLSTPVYGFGLGAMAYALGTVYLSASTDASYFGYSRVLDPLSGEETNSASYSNDLALGFAVLLLYLTQKNLCFLRAGVAIVLVALCSLGAVFLGGRAFFVVGIYCLILFIFSAKGVLIRLALLCLGVMFVGFFISDATLDSFPQANLLFSRFSGEGANSARWESWSDAFDKIPVYPLGGFELRTSSYFGVWYHNLWLDTARTSGWLPLAPLFFVNIQFVILAIGGLIRNSTDLRILLFVGVSSLLVCSQDVILEGNVKSFILYLIVMAYAFGEMHRKRLAKNAMVRECS